MVSALATILLVDDDASFVAATTEILELLGHSVKSATSYGAGKALISTERFSHAIFDLFLPDGSGFDLINALSRESSHTRIALVTGHSSIKSIGMNLQIPNVSYFVKPVNFDSLKQFIASTAPVQQKDSSGIDLHFGTLVGETPVMKQVYDMIERVSGTGANVMLMGESGVGKEVIAQAIHNASNPDKPFVAANCGAFNRELIGSELFGHEKGAFTGATNRKAGVFELAQDGTLFLDEITEMPLDLQPNLLRALETRKIKALGATRQVDVACRVISATNRSESNIVESECMREDLYFRLAVFPIMIPPLRERKDDIGLLVQHFLADFNDKFGTQIGASDESLARLQAYDWPGNVRELRHVLHRAYIMADKATNTICLPDELASPFSRKNAETVSNSGIAVGRTVNEVERELIEKTLEHFKGQKTKTAETLGISLKTLYNKLNNYIEE